MPHLLESQVCFWNNASETFCAGKIFFLILITIRRIVNKVIHSKPNSCRWSPYCLPGSSWSSSPAGHLFQSEGDRVLYIDAVWSLPAHACVSSLAQTWVLFSRLLLWVGYLRLMVPEGLASPWSDRGRETRSGGRARSQWKAPGESESPWRTGGRRGSVGSADGSGFWNLSGLRVPRSA